MKKPILTIILFIIPLSLIKAQKTSPSTPTTPTPNPTTPATTTAPTPVATSSTTNPVPGTASATTPPIKGIIEPLNLKNEVLFSVGGNLNFVEKTQVSGLYYDVNVFCDPLLPKSNGRRSRFGIDARINQGKFVFQPDSSNLKRFFSLDDPATMPNVDVLTQRYTYVRTEIPTYLTVSLSPTYRLKNDIDFPLYLVLHFEYIQRKNTLNVEYIIREETPNTYPSDDLPGNLSTVKIENGRNKITTKEDNFNYAVGVKYFREFEDVAVNIKPMLGFGGRGNSKSWFYFTHFEVIERKLGFKIGGELRGIFTFKTGLEPSEVRDYEPYVALYFAKTFRFSKLIEILALK